MSASSGFKKIGKISLIVGLLLGAVGGWWFWKMYYQGNIRTKNQEPEILYVRTGSTVEEVKQLLIDRDFIEDQASFDLTAKTKKFDSVKPGRYRIRNGMTNRELINMLQAGLQEPVKFTFNNVHTKEQLVSRVSGKLEIDSATFLDQLENDAFISQYGFDQHSIMTLFIPNTYEFYWNTSVEQFMERMAKEYKAFWTEERKAKAKKMDKTQSECIILASIVQSEQGRFADEQATIAGLYINRLNKGMKLQSDPTVIYAIGDFTIQRVRNDDLDYDSPYNTYKNEGLPPGPILLPEPEAVDAVLNYKRSDYIYMCAEFGTGRHKFTADYDQHLKNAKAYQTALNKKGIK